MRISNGNSIVDVEIDDDAVLMSSFWMWFESEAKNRNFCINQFEVGNFWLTLFLKNSFERYKDIKGPISVIVAIARASLNYKSLPSISSNL